MKILVIDDDKAICELIKINMELAGYQVFVANDGEIGFALAKQELPKVIILDVMMPDVDGYTPDIPMVSGTSDSTVRDITVTYSNKQFEVVYYYNGDEVMRSMEYFGYTVEVKPYEKGHVSVNDWHTINVKVEDGKFVMPDMGVYFSNIPIGEVGIEKNEGKDDSQKPMEIGLAIAVIAIAATMVLLTLRRH